MTGSVNDDSNTTLSPEEEVQLIPNLATRQELNEWERANILLAYDWALSSRTLKTQAPLTEAYIRNLHYRMFEQTWKWAGMYRTTEKNIGIAHHLIRDRLAGLLGDTLFWLENKTFEPDEIAVRLHHRMVFIHPFPNGNGRHARLMADVLAKTQGRQLFSWGGAEIMEYSKVRSAYIDALQAADKNDISALLAFARS